MYHTQNIDMHCWDLYKHERQVDVKLYESGMLLYFLHQAKRDLLSKHPVVWKLPPFIPFLTHFLFTQEKVAQALTWLWKVLDLPWSATNSFC